MHSHQRANIFSQAYHVIIMLSTLVLHDLAIQDTDILALDLSLVPRCRRTWQRALIVGQIVFAMLVLRAMWTVVHAPESNTGATFDIEEDVVETR
jgi:hypothetical protein